MSKHQTDQQRPQATQPGDTAQGTPQEQADACDLLAPMPLLVAFGELYRQLDAEGRKAAGTLTLGEYTPELQPGTVAQLERLFTMVRQCAADSLVRLGAGRVLHQLAHLANDSPDAPAAERLVQRQLGALRSRDEAVAAQAGWTWDRASQFWLAPDGLWAARAANSLAGTYYVGEFNSDSEAAYVASLAAAIEHWRLMTGQ